MEILAEYCQYFGINISNRDGTGR